jgi:hypothetical protein
MPSIFREKPGLTVDAIAEHFAGKGYSSREVQELRRELEALEAKLSEHEADPSAHDEPPPFAGMPKTGGAMLDDHLNPQRRTNPRRGERIAGDAALDDFARTYPHAERIRTLT